MAEKDRAPIGIDPVFVDYTALPQFTPEMFRSYIDAQIERVRDMGYDVTSCLIDLGDTAEAVTAEALKARDFDCVLIGAGFAATARAVAVVRKDHQLDPSPRAESRHLLQHHAGGHRGSGEALGAI